MSKEGSNLAWELRNEASKSLTYGKEEESKQFKLIAQAVETPIIRVESRFLGKLPSFIKASQALYKR